MLTVRLYTDPVISKVAAQVTEFNEDLQKLAEDMVITMHQYHGVGLAANQVGVCKQLCVIWADNKSQIVVLVNPKIIAVSKKKDSEDEGCLSCPGTHVKMKRPQEIVVDAQTLQGESIRYQFTDFDARIVQHEIDHLNGKCIAHFVLQSLKR